MYTPKIEIKTMNENGVLGTSIFIDGNELPGVRSFHFSQNGGYEVPVLTIDLNAVDVTVDSYGLLFQKGEPSGIKEIIFNVDDKRH